MKSKKFPFFIKKSKVSGKGSFASRNIKIGEIINIFGGKEYTEAELDALIEKGKIRIDDDVQIGHDKFLAGPGDDYFTNHSCEPNAGIQNGKEIIAICDIKKDEEITIDYSTISAPAQNQTKFSNEEWVMKCKCGTSSCRKQISFVGTLPKQTLKKYLKLGIIPDFIKKNIKV